MRLLKGDDELIKYIYENGTGGINDILLQRYAGGFDKAVRQVFGAGRKYPELERQLRINAGRFGTYKTFDLCRELEKAREAGLSEDEFKEFASGGIGLFNSYQKTEYNTMVARSRTAKQWERFQDEKLLYPNIEWLRTASANPRTEHLAYIGLILPMDDPFWTNNQPGNLYNCKCDWRTTDKPATQGPDHTYKPAAGLEGNPAVTGELVTERHPYFRRGSNAPAWVADKALLQLPDDVCFINQTTPAGKTYFEHLLIGKEAEAVVSREFAAILADNGYSVELLPIMHKNETALRSRYYGKIASATKCPDARINGVAVEFKSMEKLDHRNFNHQLKDADEKAQMVVVKLMFPANFEELQKAAENQFKLRNNLNRIYFYNNGELVKFRRKKAK